VFIASKFSEFPETSEKFSGSPYLELYNRQFYGRQSLFQISLLLLILFLMNSVRAIVFIIVSKVFRRGFCPC